MSDTTIRSIADKYRLREVLGEGAMGMVYLAEQLDSEGRVLREVAVKMMLASLVRDRDFIRRFLREVRVATRLHGPNVVTIYDSGVTSEGEPYFVMECARGPTLRDVLREGRLALPRALDIAAQICDALAEAHGLPEPIVHRDLKPPNIFVLPWHGRDLVKVGDFGIAKVLGEHTTGLTQVGQSPGTPRYMPPEQWMGQEVDARADLYALGIILYEMLAGQPPFSGSGSAMALMYQHLHSPPPALPETVPLWLRELVESLLAKDPASRPESATQVRAMLEHGKSSPPPESQPATDITPARPTSPSADEPSHNQVEPDPASATTQAAPGASQRTATTLVIVLVVGALAAAGFTAWRNHVQSEAVLRAERASALTTRASGEETKRVDAAAEATRTSGEEMKQAAAARRETEAARSERTATAAAQATRARVEEMKRAAAARASAEEHQRTSPTAATRRTIKVVLRGINFDYGKAAIRADARPILDETTRVLRDDREIRIMIAGHTCSPHNRRPAAGTESANYDLSLRRARAARDYLIARGVWADRIEIKGYGESQPVAANDTESGRAQNDRVEFMTLP
jgi:serine/threonine protein kinase/outer membrane protein OmpA-like peptidoglycan-associated protein